MGPHGFWQAWIRDEGSRNQTFVSLLYTYQQRTSVADPSHLDSRRPPCAPEVIRLAGGI